tara:strand:+ start:18 stop:200 length:183 start_codon:yes stop_codon:yes gene_type:complete
MEKKYSKEEIKWAVNIAVGDDGFRSKEVIEILESEDEKETLYYEDKIEGYCEKRLDTDGI